MDSQRQKTEILTRWATLYHREMFRFALFRLGSQSDAEDCVQELFLKLLQGTTSLSEVRSPRSFLLRSLANHCIDMRRQRKISLQPLAADLQSDEEPTSIDEPERINRLLARLPDDQAEVIRMRTCDALSFAEIAEILEIPLPTAKSRFAYGIEKLRRMFHN